MGQSGKLLPWKRASGASIVGTKSRTVRLRTFSQALLAMLAGTWRWDGMLPASAPTGRAFRADKRDTFGLTVQVHWLRNISSTAATWAVVRSQHSPSSGLRHCHRHEREIRCRLFCVTNHEQIRVFSWKGATSSQRASLTTKRAKLSWDHALKETAWAKGRMMMINAGAETVADGAAFHQLFSDLRKTTSMTPSPSQSHNRFNALLRSFGTALGGVQKHVDVASCDFAAIT